MNEEMIKKLAQCCNQSHAAAFAVLTSAVRKEIEDLPDNADLQDVVVMLHAIELEMVDSLCANDSEVAHHIGLAARQMNSLL